MIPRGLPRVQLVTLKEWGNSFGIRIPLSEIKTIKGHVGEEFKLSINKKGALTLTPITRPQKKWLEAFNEAADKENNKLLLDTKNAFDENEWEW